MKHTTQPLRIQNPQLGIRELYEEDSFFDVLGFRFSVVLSVVVHTFRQILRQ